MYVPQRSYGSLALARMRAVMLREKYGELVATVAIRRVRDPGYLNRHQRRYLVRRLHAAR